MNSDPLKLMCPCGSQLAKSKCCVRYIQGFENAPTPEALMRSRYTAFTMGTGEAASYLFATHHPGFRSPNLKQDLAEGMDGICSPAGNRSD
ncbi:MAG: hypothetical protein JKY61_03170 [Planctomycetes bacterium]|nr:hypothetical protein [Planctomycetota bacterium]